jgi:hypothetical protein
MDMMREKVAPAIKFPALKAEHVNKWIVMSSHGSRLISVGNSLPEALKRAEKHTERKTVFKFVPAFYGGAAL